MGRLRIRTRPDHARSPTTTSARKEQGAQSPVTGASADASPRIFRCQRHDTDEASSSEEETTMVEAWGSGVAVKPWSAGAHEPG